ncbi:MAG: TonB-dependent receptor [candidate division Zixibacteria bacterium]|nr:TonB-dependent receptor [candidate division Zixibacteria bacterium]
MKSDRTVFSVVSTLLLTFALAGAQEPASASSTRLGTSGAEKDTSETEKLPVYQMDELVVTANRYERAAFEVPYAVSVFSEQKLQSSGAFTISGLLNRVSGVDISDAGPFRTRPNVRGLSGSRILVLVDGQRLNDTRENTFSGAELSLVSPGLVQQVEILRGSNSVLFGSNAMGGVVNILTKKPPLPAGQWKLSGDFSSRYSTNDEQRFGRLGLNLVNHRWRLKGGAEFRRANHYHAPGSGLFEWGRQIANSNLKRAVGLDFIGDYQLAEKHSLSLSAQSSLNSGIGFPETPNPTFPVGIFFPYHDRSKVSLTYEGKQLTSKLAGFKASVYGQKNKKELRTDITLPGVPFPGATLYDTTHTYTNVLTVGTNLQQILSLAGNQTLTYGLDYYREMIDGFTREFSHIPFINSHKVKQSAAVPENHMDALGLYAQNDIRPAQPLSFKLGTRFDWYRQAAEKTEGYNDVRTGQPLDPKTDVLTSFSGSVGAQYEVVKGIRVGSNVGSGFRVPNLVEKFFSGTQDQQIITPNLDLEAEKNVSVDAGVKFRFLRFSGSVTAFLNQLRDYIELRATGDSVTVSGRRQAVWSYENVSKVRFQGIEGEFETQLPKGFSSFLNASYQSGDNLSAHRAIYVAPAKIVVGLGWKGPRGRFETELSNRYVFGQNRVDPDPSALLQLPTPSFNIVSFRTGYSWRVWTLTASVNNLTNQTYREPLNAASPFNPILEPGRNFIIGLSTRF